jgi:hypothetical protein
MEHAGGRFFFLLLVGTLALSFGVWGIVGGCCAFAGAALNVYVAFFCHALFFFSSFLLFSLAFIFSFALGFVQDLGLLEFSTYSFAITV